MPEITKDEMKSFFYKELLLSINNGTERSMEDVVKYLTVI